MGDAQYLLVGQQPFSAAAQPMVEEAGDVAPQNNSPLSQRVRCKTATLLLVLSAVASLLGGISLAYCALWGKPHNHAFNLRLLRSVVVPTKHQTFLPSDVVSSADLEVKNHPGWKSSASSLWPMARQGWKQNGAKLYFHGGMPEQPMLHKNATCYLSNSLLELVGQYEAAGFDWSHCVSGSPNSVVQGGEATRYQAQAILQAQDYLEKTPEAITEILYPYRQMQVALDIFGEAAELRSSGAPAVPTSECPGIAHWTGSVGPNQPWGTPDPAWDFTKSAARDVYVDEVIMKLADRPELQGGKRAVFFDEVDQGGCCDAPCHVPGDYNDGVYSMLPRVVKALNDKKIVPILSMSARVSWAANRLCSSQKTSYEELVKSMHNLSWVRFYENWPYTPYEQWDPTNQVDAVVIGNSIRNAIFEAEQGVPNVLHSGWFKEGWGYSPGGGMAGPPCPGQPGWVNGKRDDSVFDTVKVPLNTEVRPGRLGGPFEWLVAAYLIVQSPGSLLALSTSWSVHDLCVQPEAKVSYGEPLGPPVEDPKNVWSREYTRASVRVDLRFSPAVGQTSPWYSDTAACPLGDSCGSVTLKA